MTKDRRREFGRRGAKAPPVLTNAPDGVGGGRSGSPRFRKRSLGIGLVSVGALSLGGFALFEAFDRKPKCHPDQNDWDQQECSNSSGRGGSGSRSGSSHSFFSSSGSATSHGVSFGGFGSTGSAHSGGGA